MLKEEKLFNKEQIQFKCKEISTMEYNDYYPHILSQSKEDFLSNIYERVLISSNQKFNGKIPTCLSKENFDKYILETYYYHDLKKASFIMKQLHKKQRNLSEIKTFCGPIISHCQSEESQPIVHTCGALFSEYTFNTNEKKQIFLYCFKCNYIYKQSFIKCQCNICKNDFYTKILNQTNNDSKSLPFATWKKYHCNAVVNDKMKCMHCKTDLLYNKSNNTLICKKCDKVYNPQSILWLCLICKKQFKSEIKEYNSYEFKNIQISVKDTLIKKIKAKPNIKFCECDCDIKKVIFLHKDSCKGELYLGEMNRKKILVCSKCESLIDYDTYTWTCPNCGKSYTINKEKRRLSKSKINHSNDKIVKRNNRCYNTTAKKIKVNIPLPSNKKSNLFKIMSPSTKVKINLNEDFYKLKRYNSNNLISKEDNIVKNLSDMFSNESEKEEKSGSKNEQSSFNSNISKKVSFNSRISGSTKSSINNSNKIKDDYEESSYTHNKIISNFNVDDYLIEDIIGEGSFGKIYSVENIEGDKYAMKKLVGATSNDMKSLQNEYNILMDLHKLNSDLSLVNIYGIQEKQLDITTSALYILMDLADTDWEKEIKERATHNLFYTEHELIRICKHLIKTFAQLQKSGISHRDIKPQNILVFKQTNQYKLADFGEAKNKLKIENNTYEQTLRGTELYMAPILFKSLRTKCGIKSVEHNTYKSDVFSFGLCVLYAATLSKELIYKIREIYSDSKVRKIISSYLCKYYSKDFIQLIYLMLTINEKERYDFIKMEKYIYENF